METSDELRELLLGLPFSKRGKHDVARVAKSLNKHLSALEVLLKKASHQSSALKAAVTEIGRVRALPAGESAVQAKRAVVICSIAWEPAIARHFHESEFYKRVKGRFLRSVAHAHVQGMAQAPARLVCLVAARAELFDERFRHWELQQPTTSCPVGSCTSEQTANAEAPPPLGSQLMTMTAS